MKLIFIMILIFIIGYDIKDRLIEINKNLETLISLERGAK
jgi:hypothetical protein